jgi:cyclopropane-fatty-acyl-phospholipid synthase
MWEFYLISAEMMFRTGSQLVFHMQLARKRDAVPITRDYVTDIQRRYKALEAERLPLVTAVAPSAEVGP